MAKSFFEEMGGRYEKRGDYLIPCILKSRSNYTHV